jgi:hypothetical protein
LTTHTLPPSLPPSLLGPLQLFSQPKFLFSRPDNYLLVMQLVDTLNNLVQYQHEGNTQLLYSIVLKKHCIERVRETRARPHTSPHSPLP